MTPDLTALVASLRDYAAARQREHADDSAAGMYSAAADAIESLAARAAQAEITLGFVAHAIGHDHVKTPDLSVALSERLDAERDRYERAEAERDLQEISARKYRAERDALLTENAQLMRELQAALAERDALRHDAERYRYIRGFHRRPILLVVRPDEFTGDTILCESEVDDIIDATLARENK